MQRMLLLLVALATGPASALEVRAPVHHDLEVTLQPADRSLEVRDRISLPVPADRLVLELHTDLKPKFTSSHGEVRVLKKERHRHWQRYRLKLPPGSSSLRVDYSGKIHHALSSSRAEQSRGFRSSAGIIDDKGVFLAGSSLWFPKIEDRPYLTYSMQVQLPGGWSSVSQGRREQQQRSTEMTREQWSIDKPQEEIYLIAGRFTEYARPVQSQSGKVQAQVFLRKEDQRLANRYLDATARYLQMYERLLGPYAYAKFALVENFWETGYGMPSFTLLGSRVIRLPFILNSSYPHEILHNWWGNGVYVDFASGNWSEGLTAYLADHLIKEQQGQDASYRQQSLQKYRDYASKNRDFPLSRFRSRHSSATEAVGYGKTLMLFHMLRKKLGDRLFTKALQKLYRDYQFRIAAFDDLEKVFSRVYGQSLQQFFDQWVQRSGAPELELKQSRVEKQDPGYRLELTIAQVQPGDPYHLDIPIAVSLAGEGEVREFLVQLSSTQQSYHFELEREPTRVDIDPQFDLFRKLAMEETPPAFTQVFGASDLLVITPAGARDDMQDAWRAFAERVSHMGPERVSIVADNELDALPKGQAVLVLGWRNRFAAQLQQEMTRHPVQFEPDQVLSGLTRQPKQNHAFAWVTRVDGAGSQAWPRALITADLAASLPGLARKIPHYHKYSYLAFAGDEPENRLKGRWPVTGSPLTRIFKPDAQRARLQKSVALIEPVSSFDAQRMMQTIRFLSAERLQGRGLGSEGLEQAADYIARAFAQAGLKPAGDNGGYFQHFTATAEDGSEKSLKNVVAVIPGRHPRLAKENLVLGAHYDHLGLGWPDVRGENKGLVHHGADDNASGVAVMLELARVMGPGFRPDRSILFAAFSGEEAGRLGSRHYIKSQTEHPAAKSIGMLNLDTVGRLFDDKLMVLGAESATEWPHIFRGIGFVTGIESVMVNEPLDASDQISFHQAGVPAVQLFSGANADYHRPGDTADKIDTEGLVKVATVSRQVIEYLAAREQPMTITLAGGKRTNRSAGSRKVSLGTIPDFSYQGEGCRLDGTTPGSPAEQAGLRKQDIILRIDEQKISGLRDLSRVLKSMVPGQSIEIEFLRGDERSTVQAVLRAR